MTNQSTKNQYKQLVKLFVSLHVRMKRRDRKFESERIELVERFEIGSNRIYFDVEEFEIIIEYYLEYLDIESAEKALKIAFCLHPNNPDLLLKQSEINFHKSDFRAALQCLKKYPNPNDSEMLFWQGKSLIELDCIDLACECFNTIAENEKNDKNFDVLCFDIARAFYDERFCRISIEWLKKGYAFNPKNTLLINYYAQQYSFLNQYEEAIDLLNKSLDLDPYQSSVWAQLCSNLLKVGKLNEAIEAIDFTILLNKENSMAWQLKGDLLCDAKEFDKAIKCLSKAKDLATSPEEKSECFFLLADCFEQKGDYTNALSCYQENIRLNKELGISDSASLLGYAYSLLETEKYDEALKICEELSKTFPDLSEGWFYKGEVFSALNRFDEAEECYIKAIETENNQEFLYSAFISLGNIYLEKEELEKALEIYNKAYKTKKDDKKLLLLLSITHYKLNNKTEAFSFLKKVAKNDAEAIRHFLKICPEAKNETNSLLK